MWDITITRLLAHWGQRWSCQLNPSWWHDIETFSALLTLCEGDTPVTSGSPSQKASNDKHWRSFFFSLNKLSDKQSRYWWFETPLRSCDDAVICECDMWKLACTDVVQNASSQLVTHMLLEILLKITTHVAWRSPINIWRAKFIWGNIIRYFIFYYFLRHSPGKTGTIHRQYRGRWYPTQAVMKLTYIYREYPSLSTERVNYSAVPL